MTPYDILILSMKTVFISCLFICFLLFSIYWIDNINGVKKSPMINTPTAFPTKSITIDPDKIYSLVNSYRVNHGLNSLKWNQSMCDFAYTRLQQIHTDFSHTGYWNNPHPYGTTQDSTGENLEDGASSDEQIILDDWITSPEHKSNIIDQRFTQTCVVSDFYNGQNYIVQEFSSK